MDGAESRKMVEANRGRRDGRGNIYESASRDAGAKPKSTVIEIVPAPATGTFSTG
jgi:hypothetical protein